MAAHIRFWASLCCRAHSPPGTNTNDSPSLLQLPVQPDPDDLEGVYVYLVLLVELLPRLL